MELNYEDLKAAMETAVAAAQAERVEVQDALAVQSARIQELLNKLGVGGGGIGGSASQAQLDSLGVVVGNGINQVQFDALVSMLTRARVDSLGIAVDTAFTQAQHDGLVGSSVPVNGALITQEQMNELVALALSIPAAVEAIYNPTDAPVEPPFQL